MFTFIAGVLVLIFSGLSLIYLSHMNAVATKGYTVKKYQEKRIELQADLAIWNLKLSRLKSLDTLLSSSEVANMLPYIELPNYVQKDAQLALSTEE